MKAAILSLQNTVMKGYLKDTEASTRVEGEEIIFEGAELRDKLTQQTGTFDLRLRWFENSQALGIVQAVGTFASDDD